MASDREDNFVEGQGRRLLRSLNSQASRETETKKMDVQSYFDRHFFRYNYLSKYEWETEFNARFLKLDVPKWVLTFTKEKQLTGCHRLIVKGQVMFDCQKCGRWWISNNGVAACYYRFSQSKQQGKVKLILGGQKCERCNEGYEDPKWFRSDLKTAVSTLTREILQKYYSDRYEVKLKKPTETRHNTASMSGPHRADLCQFCKLGLCNGGSEKRSQSVSDLSSLLHSLSF